MRAASALAAIVALQWVVVVATIGFSLRGLVLAGLAAALVAATAAAIGGAICGAAAAIVWAIAPAVLPYWRSDFRPLWHHQLLPVLYGARESRELLAGIALLLALLAVVRLPWRLGLPAALVGALAAAALARLDSATWSFAWSAFTLNLSRIREVGWSLRLVEYLPVAGLIGIVLRRPRAGLALAAAMVAAIVIPFGRGRGDLLHSALVVVPGLPLYAVAAGGITLLVPLPVRRHAAAVLRRPPARLRRAAPARP